MVADETTDKDIHHALKYNYPFEPRLLCTNPNRKGILFPTYVDTVLHSIARRCLLPNEDFTEMIWGMKGLLLTREERLELLVELELHYGWPYDEHWYACYFSLEILCKQGFPAGQLTDADLVITKLLCKLWEKIYRAIQKISSSFGAHHVGSTVINCCWYGGIQ